MSFPSPGDFPNPVIESRSPELKADSLLTEPPGKSVVVSVAYLKETWEEVVSSFGKIYLRLDKPYLAMRDRDRKRNMLIRASCSKVSIHPLLWSLCQSHTKGETGTCN